MDLAESRLFWIIRRALGPVGRRFPTVKRFGRSVFHAVQRPAARPTHGPAADRSVDVWLHRGRQRWRAQRDYGDDKLVHVEVPGARLKIADRLAQSDAAIARLPDDLTAAADMLREDNLEWATHIAAQADTAGYLEAVMVGVSYFDESYYLRNLSLFAELYGADAAYPPAVEAIPEDMRAAFTMAGRIPVEMGYRNGRYPARFADVLRDGDLDRLDAIAAGALDTLPSMAARAYTNGGPLDSDLLDILRDRIASTDVAVFGSIDLSREAACLRAGARSVTSLRFLPFVSHCARIRAIGLEEARQRADAFDVIVAVSSVESFHLGSFGEPLDADGDLALVRSFGHMLRPGGRLVLSVPVGQDRLVFNTGRIYGRLRLPRLLEGWEQEHAVRYEDAMLDSMGIDRPLFILRKPAVNVGNGRRTDA